MAKGQHTPELLAAAAKVTTRRGKVLVEHLLKHGEVSTEQLETVYGLMDAASAARDVKDAGVPLDTRRAKRTNGRQMVIYSFGDPSLIRGDRFQGRQAFPKAFKNALAEHYGPQCASCSTPYELSHLQIDHRVPYQIAGEEADGARDRDESFCFVDRVSVRSPGPASIATTGGRDDSSTSAAPAIGRARRSSRTSH